MIINKQIRQTLTFTIALATLSIVSIGCGETDSTIIMMLETVTQPQVKQK